ncbi:MAG TPA: FAD-dependent monooxygenase [Nakamurella sp.]|nr:FAD-dependent monooxygenase [Nakamurella sp.]
MLHHDINNVAGRLGSFARGRVALIGDSAHAMTPDPGQGGCLATEDAVKLVSLLGAPATVPDALIQYDRERRQRTQSPAARARMVGRVGQLRSRAGAGVRDGLLRLVPGSAFVRASTSVQRWDPPASG